VIEKDPVCGIDVEVVVDARVVAVLVVAELVCVVIVDPAWIRNAARIVTGTLSEATPLLVPPGPGSGCPDITSVAV
jgi:hypothetical protein